MTKTISIDVDGVLSDFVFSFKKIVNRLWPGRVPETYFPIVWSFGEVVNKQEFKIAWKELLNTKNFWLYEPPICQNVLDLERFVNSHEDYKVYYITHRSETAGMNALEQTNRWLERFNLLPKNASTIVVPSSEDKATLIKTLDIEYSIDDYGPTVQQSYGIPNHSTYLLRYPYNDEYSYLPSVDSLQQFLDIVAPPAGYNSLIDHSNHGYKE